MKKGKPSNECGLPDAQTEELEAKCEGRILDISYIPHRK